MPEQKTIEQLLAEQNELLRRQVALGNAQAFHDELKRSAERWDKANPVAKYFFQNPIRR